MSGFIRQFSARSASSLFPKELAQHGKSGSACRAIPAPTLTSRPQKLGYRKRARDRSNTCQTPHASGIPTNAHAPARRSTSPTDGPESRELSDMMPPLRQPPRTPADEEKPQTPREPQRDKPQRGDAGPSGTKPAGAKPSGDEAPKSKPAAEPAIVEGAVGGVRHVEDGRAGRRVDDHPRVDLKHAVLQNQGLRHPEGRAAGRRLDGPDVVPVDQEHASPQTPGDREAGEARAHHDGVVVPHHPRVASRP